MEYLVFDVVIVNIIITKMPIQRCLPKSPIGRYIGDTISTDNNFLLYVFEIWITFDWKFIIICRNKSAVKINKTLPYDESTRHPWQSKPRRGTDSSISIFYNEKFIFHGNPKFFTNNFFWVSKDVHGITMILVLHQNICIDTATANKIWQIDPSSDTQTFLVSTSSVALVTQDNVPDLTCKLSRKLRWNHIRVWINKYVHYSVWNTTTHACYNLNSDLGKPPCNFHLYGCANLSMS